MSDSQKTRIHLRRLKLKDIAATTKGGPINVLLIGSSISRKNGAAQDIAIAQSAALVITPNPENWVSRKDEFTICGAGARLSSSTFSRYKVRIIEEANIESEGLQTVLSTGSLNIISVSEYFSNRMLVQKMTHIIVFGGLGQIRNIWQDFGVLIPKFTDFRQIHLACTDENDRYSDDFLIIRNDQAKDPNAVFYWGSLQRDQAKDITMDIERTLVLAKVQSAKLVELPDPTPKQVIISDTSDIKEPVEALSERTERTEAPERTEAAAPTERTEAAAPTERTEAAAPTAPTEAEPLNNQTQQPTYPTTNDREPRAECIIC
jgi:hypothetical protein